MRRWAGPLTAGVVTLAFTWLAFAASGWGSFWWALLAVGGVAETVALARAAKGDTLSEQIWRLRDSHPAWSTALVFVMAWLAIHFVAQGSSSDGAT